MGYSKRRIKGKVHSNQCLNQKSRKNSSKQHIIASQGTRKKELIKHKISRKKNNYQRRSKWNGGQTINKDELQKCASTKNSIRTREKSLVIII
jgi:hypothetical protein